MRYAAEGVPLLVIAGREYGSGSSRDWAAKGTTLLGVRAVLAESYERIHRSNLVGMGVLPLQFLRGRERGVARAHRARDIHDRGPRRRSGAALDAHGHGARRRRHRAPVQRDRPPRRPDRGRLLPPRRDPARGPAPAGGGRTGLTVRRARGTVVPWSGRRTKGRLRTGSVVPWSGRRTNRRPRAGSVVPLVRQADQPAAEGGLGGPLARQADQWGCLAPWPSWRGMVGDTGFEPVTSRM